MEIFMIPENLIIILLIYLLIMLTIIQYKGDTSIANFTWGGGVMLVALYSFFVLSNLLARQILLTALTVIWALRLALYVYIRYTGKDSRFLTWKWQGLRALIINTIWIIGQAILLAIMATPIFIVNTAVQPGLNYLDILGLACWIIGFFFEATADYQLFVFMRNPANKGKVMQSGLWYYSRHPNYFGEIVMWWSIALIALSVHYGWIALIAPITITFLLRFVTGIPMLEYAMQDNPEYQSYKKHTSMLIPCVPSK